MRAGEKDLRPARFLAHVVDVGAHPVAVAEALARDQFVAPQQRLGAAEFHHQVAVLGTLHHAVDDLADAVLVFVVLPLALVFAHPLHDHLLGGLRGDAAEIDRRQRIDQVLADLDVRLELLGDVDRDLGFLVLHGFHGLGPSRQANVAGLAIDRGADVLLVAVLGAAGLLDGLLHRLEHFLAVDGFLPRDGIGDQQQFRTGNGGVHLDLLVSWDVLRLQLRQSGRRSVPALRAEWQGAAARPQCHRQGACGLRRHRRPARCRKTAAGR